MAANQILGLSDLTKSFKSLGQEMEKKTAARMVASGGGVLRKEARRLAEAQGLRKTGALIKNIAIKRERNVPQGTVQYNLGVRHGKDLGKKYKQLGVGRNGRVKVFYRDNPYYWSFLEFGHRIVARNSSQAGGGKTTYSTRLRNGKIKLRTRVFRNSSLTVRRRSPTGFVPAKPYIGPALVNKRESAIEAMSKVLLKDLEKAGK